MAKQAINNGESGAVVREKINDNFTELYSNAVDVPAVALVDGATIDITGPKHTLSTATGRTFTISHAGDDIVLVITLSATSATFTFPDTALCVADGTASGDNTLVITGATSGDKHVVAIIKVGSAYYVASKNVGQ